MAEVVETPGGLKGPEVQLPESILPESAPSESSVIRNPAPAMDINERLSTRYYMRTNPAGFDSDDVGNLIDPTDDTVEPAVEPVVEPVDPLDEAAQIGGTESRDIVEDIETLGEVLPDVAQGLLLSGPAKGFHQINKLDPTGILPKIEAFGNRIAKFLGIDPSIDEAKTLPGKLAEGFGQFLPGIIPATKVARLMIGTSNIIRRVAAEVLGGLWGDYATSSEKEAEGLVGLVKMIDADWAQKFGDTIQHFITKGGGEDIDDFRARLVGAAPGVLLTPILAPLLEGLIKIATSALKSGAANDLVKVFDDVQADAEGAGRGGEELRRVGTTGQFVGAPRGLDTPRRLAGLRRRLTNLAEQADAANPVARFWYERSGRSILGLTGGDIDQADTFVQLLAVLSRGNPVQNNMDAALRAWNQHHAGGTISAGRFPNKDRAEIIGVLDGTGDVSGLKRTAFYANLMQEIDPSRVPADAVTVDLWIMRAFGFKTKGGPHKGQSVTPQQNAFVRGEIQRLAGELGWEPHQVQAAIWVAQKARHEGTSIQASSFDFSNALETTRGQLNWEAIPHPDDPDMGWLYHAPPEVKADYHQAAARAFLDENGDDIIPKRLGVLSTGDFHAPGAFEGGVQPGAATRLPIAGRTSAKPGERIDADTRLLLDVMTGLRLALLRQKAGGWHRPFYQTSMKQADSIDIRIGRGLTTDETEAVYREIMALGGHVDFAPISTERGFRVFNGDWTGIDNKKMHEIVERATENVIESDFDPIAFRREGTYLDRDVKGDPDGQVFRNIAGKAGRPDLQGRADLLYEEIGSRLDAIDAAFAEDAGLTHRLRIPEAEAKSQGLTESGRVTKEGGL